ncbi:hypothetical protein VPH35_042509 [Triticum aestivum]|uniref:uncharacterized protein n=1 Tax=Triticum aestivum TaxID=4565 RepID=UPI001D00B08D|nr:uncharacterized protein LOC123057747 [Triticum aestivum]
MEQGAGKKLGKTKASKCEVSAPPRSEVSALELPGAPTGSGVAALQLPGAPPPPTQPEVDTTRRLHGDVPPSQATALQLAGAPAQPPQAEVSPRRLAIVPGPAHVPPQADASWLRSLLEALRLRFPGPVVARIFEAFEGAWASVHGWWSGPPLAVAAPELKKKKKKKSKKNKKPVLPAVRRHKAFLFTKTKNDDRQTKKDDRQTKKDDLQTKKDDLHTKKDDRQTKKDVPVIVDGETVPAEIVEGYKRYCRIATSSPATTTVCHLCIFEVELHPNGIVRTTDMIAHCYKHKSVAVWCGRFGCAAKVPPGRDLRWHTHICHDLPADWWLP